MRIGFVGLGGYSVFMAADHFPAEGETVSAAQFCAEPGGKGFNQAVAAARLGADCVFWGAFGRDREAAFCLDFLGREGVSARPFYKEKPTACACILTDASGENRVAVYRGAAALLTAADIAESEPEIASLSMLVLQNEVDASANLKACEIAFAHGVPVLINPAPAANFDRALLKCAAVITPNEHEAKLLFGEDWESGLKAAAVRRAVVTLGGRGAAVCEDGCVTRVPAERAVARDTTGAGDCFTAALAVGLAEGASLQDAARFASKAAAIAVSRRYAVAAMPKRCEIK